MSQVEILNSKGQVANRVDATKVLQTEIQKLKECADALGYPSVKELVKSTMREWDSSAFIREKYEEFLTAVQNGASKEPYKKNEYWNEEDSFEQYLFYCKKECEFRLEQLTAEKNNSAPTYGNLINLSKDTPSNLANTDILKTLQPEDVEFYSMILRKSYEDLVKALSVDNFVQKCIEKSKSGMIN